MAKATAGILAVCLAPACQSYEAGAGGPYGVGDVVEGEAPAAPGSGEPFLATAADGSVVMSWIEPLESGHALRFARWSGGGWSSPSTIAEGENFFVNWADFPSITELPDGRMAAHWLARAGPGRYAYDVRISWSSDDGASWSEPITPHTDGIQTEHGFVSLFPVEDMIGAAWLDGRELAGDGEHVESDGAMTLRFATIDTRGELADEAVLDAQTCECCQTSAAITSSGPVVVYRDRLPGEIRDIAVTRLVGGSWTAPAPVHADGWVIAGCPVNGPAVAAAGETVVVAWFTAAQDTPRVRVAFSADAGATFSPPVRVDDGDPAGRVDILLTGDGVAFVSWLERVGEDAAIRVRAVTPDGLAGSTTTVAPASVDRAGGFPRIVRMDDRLLFAWTAPGTPSRIRVATALLESATSSP